MKTKFNFLIFFLFLLFFSNTSIAQSSQSLVFSDNYNTVGYLILQKSNPNINHYRIVVNRVTYSQQNVPIYTPVERLELWRVNYWEIPTAYTNQWTDQYAIIVEGLNASNQVLDTEVVPVALDPDNPPSNNYQIYNCESYNTAFRIQQSYNNGVINYLVGQSDDYMWFPMGYWPGGVFGYPNTVDGPSSLSLNFQGDFLWNVPNNPNLPNAPIYRRPDGTMIGGEHPFVYGIQKTKFPWCGTETVYGTRTDGSLSWSIEDAMMGINASQGWQCADLICNEMFEIEWGTESEGNTDVVDYLWRYRIKEWKHSMKDDGTEDQDGDGDEDFWDSFDDLISQFAIDASLEDWSMSDLSYLNIAQISETGAGQLFTFNSSDLKDSQGTPTPPTFTVNPGIFQVTFSMANGKLYQFYMPFEEKLTNNFALSNYVSLNAFPVPITGNQFNLNIQSSAKLDITVDVKDLNGRTYFTNRLSLRDGHDVDHKIVLNPSTPNGMLVITARFSDGSTKTLLVSKAS